MFSACACSRYPDTLSFSFIARMRLVMGDLPWDVCPKIRYNTRVAGVLPRALPQSQSGMGDSRGAPFYGPFITLSNIILLPV